jgi:hypothetical protein
MLMIVPLDILMRLKGIARVLEGTQAGMDLLENSGVAQGGAKGKNSGAVSGRSSRSLSSKSI